jgi:phage anti-repressor protein
MINNNEIKTTTDSNQDNQLSNIGQQIFKSDNIISLALEHTKDRTLTEYEFAKLMNFTEKEVDMLKVYWNPIFNDSCIYLSDELILGNLTNETKKNAINHFYERILLKGDFQVGIDYKEISSSDDLVIYRSPNLGSDILTTKPAHNKKYYAVTGETYKCLLLSSRTNKGKETRRYYIKVEVLARNMKDYIFEHFKIQKQLQLKEKDLQLTQSEKDKDKYLSLYNTQVQKHRFHKFNVSGPCFYIITKGLDYADGITRIKIRQT